MTSPDTPPQRSRIRRLLRVLIATAQERIATALGVSRVGRIETVAMMLESNARRAPGYWLQLFLATGIATLGLALGSTAVVIGGMLVSPLMGPIVELGMGFAVGSPLLVIRAFLRVILSATVVIATAALITLTLPFHEVTLEISSRAAPTLLDLLVAVFCALAAAYTTVRQTADTTAAAAGTAIGIALVPPLCVVGYGIGTGSGPITSGSTLLFTANFSAIVLVAVLSFLALGYNQVGAAEFEHNFMENKGTRTDRIAERAHLGLRSLFGSRYGLGMRLLLPAIVLAAVAVPLKRALDEVAWEVRVRDAIQREIQAENPQAVQSALTIERKSVALRLLIIAAPEEAAELERRLGTRIEVVSGIRPAVSVIAVPDANIRKSTLAAESRAPAPVLGGIDLAEAKNQLGSALNAVWPAAAAGPLLGWTLELDQRGDHRVSVRHLGPPLGPSAEAMLSRSISGTMRSSIRVVDRPFPAGVLEGKGEPDSAWVATAMSVLEELPRVDSAWACLTRPTGRRRNGDALATMLTSTAAARAGRLTIHPGEGWTIRVSRAPCPGDSTASRP